jgi:hypothetical protein
VERGGGEGEKGDRSDEGPFWDREGERVERKRGRWREGRM